VAFRQRLDGVAIFTYILIMLLVPLKIWCRYRHRGWRNVQWDDYLSIVALALANGFFYVCIIGKFGPLPSLAVSEQQLIVVPGRHAGLVGSTHLRNPKPTPNRGFLEEHLRGKHTLHFEHHVSQALGASFLLASIRDQGSYHNLHRYCRGNYLVYRHCKSYIPVSDRMFSDFNTDYNVP
jgi:hypothetical protein